jgi:deoxyribonuclease-4
VAGGLPLAFERAEGLGCTAMQIFVKNASRWQGRPLVDQEVAAFQAAWRTSAVGPVVAHGAYLLNLAAPPGEVLERSRGGLADELARCDRLGLAGLVVHPGAHLGRGEEAGLAAVAASLDAVLGPRPEGPARVLLEVTAGQGTCLGHRLEHLERILELAACRERVGVCLDTCHLLAAGYPVDEPEGALAVAAEAAARFGRDRLACVHVNDSRHPRGSRRDRHANLGAGCIPPAAFAALLAAPALAGVPFVVETPAEDDLAAHRADLDLLRRLAAAPESAAETAGG